MPTFPPEKLSDAQLADIAAFIWSLASGAQPVQPSGLPKTGEPAFPYAPVVAVACFALLGGVALRLRPRRR